MNVLNVVKVNKGIHKGELGEIQNVDNNLFKPYYVVFNNGNSCRYDKTEIENAEDNEAVEFLRSEINELYKLICINYEELHSSQLDSEKIIEVIDNPELFTSRLDKVSAKEKELSPKVI